MEKLITKPGNIFLTKSDRIFLETSWFLKFEIWRVSLIINCNFRYLNQVSHRNNQPKPFSTSWHGMKFGIFLSISLCGYLRISPWQNKLLFDTINWTTWVILKMISNLPVTHFFFLSQMMSSIVPFCQGLSLNLISTLYQVQKLKLMEMHRPSTLWTIYAQCIIGLDSDVFCNFVPFV